MSETAKVFEDREHAGDWRVEFVDDDGGCEVAIVAGPNAKERAIRYADRQYGTSKKSTSRPMRPARRARRKKPRRSGAFPPSDQSRCDQEPSQSRRRYRANAVGAEGFRSTKTGRGASPTHPGQPPERYAQTRRSGRYRE